MQPKDIAKETAKVLQSYLTYQAVKVIIEQLNETNPGAAIWLRQFSSGNKLQNGEAYLEEIMSQPRGKEFALRIMTVRESIAEQTLEFLPEMVATGIMQANLLHRRHLLERLTQTEAEASQSTENSLDSIEPKESSE
ncbi:chaperonin family protein RbcX [Myxosarcina sp. GI1]|uniref:chaperonin family protein RbcX n=1 Tax=Myxosarcina sp. GI1 TaxID=1541065 RepID=UPI0005660E32